MAGVRQSAAPRLRPEFFSHPAGPDLRGGSGGATRYLCGAVYLDDTFADTVIEELMEDGHRAVARSTDVDVYEVLRHCFRFRRMMLARDTLIATLLLIGLITATLFTLGWILVGGLAGATLRFGWRRRSPLLTTCGYLVSGLVLVAAWIFYATPGAYESLFLDPFFLLSGDFLLELVARAPNSPPFLLAVACVLVLTAFRMWTYHILTQELAADRPAAGPVGPLSPNRRVARRGWEVRAAQWGNVTLYAADSPFVGAGTVAHAWSICVELDRAPGTTGPPVTTPGTVTLDPVALHAAVRQRLASLGDERLPEPERVPGLQIYDHVVAAGDRRHDDPLIDPVRRVPYAVASPEAVAAMIRYPQGSMRYYQRIVLGAVGKPVRGTDGGLVTPAQDQEIVVSAFVHLAVEGGMLYAEFVSTVLPPIRPQYHLIDRLPTAAGPQLAARAVVDSLGYLAAGSAGAPVRLLDLGWRMIRLTRRMRQADRASQEYRTYNYGARRSLRELVAHDPPGTYLQQLDTEKYSKLIERRLTNAVLDFLEAQQIDTGEYRTRVNVIHNSGVMITGGSVAGAVAGGPGATANNTNGAGGSG